MNSTVQAADGADSNDLLQRTAVWRDSLKKGRLALQQVYREGGRDCGELLYRHATLVDELLATIWQAFEMPPELALIAVGGYGRGELYPYSDIDLLILLPGEEDATLRQKLEQLIGALWDTGLEVGHSVRTLDECVAEAAKDITVQTTLLEARCLVGDKGLFRRFEELVREGVDARVFYEAKLFEQQQRHTRHHDAAYNLEPNLKENPGGLRDLQNVLWISRALGIGRTWKSLVEEGIITAPEVRKVHRLERFLQDLRIRLHLAAGRREDRLLFNYQSALADEIGFSPRAHATASECLMQHYYRTAKAITVLNEILLRNLRIRAIPPPATEPIPINERFSKRNGLLLVRDENVFQDDPSAIFESLLLMQQHSDITGMSAQALRALWRSGKLIDARFRRDPKNRALFMEIMRAPRGITATMRRMNRYGLLGRYIPAFGRIVGQMQHDLFHVYTVDEHILFVLRNLRRFAVFEFTHEFPLCSRLISEFERPELLYIAALFHDIAKGRGGDHSTLGAAEARPFCKAHGLPPEDTALVGWLVENHLVMSLTAQKQDLGDPDVIAAFAAKVGNVRRLTALYLLTVSDIRGTSPKVWNAWKGKLLEDLYFLTKNHLAGAPTSSEAYLEARQLDALRILRQFTLAKDAQSALWAQLDESYFQRHNSDEIAWHTRHLHRLVNTAKPFVKARLSPLGEGVQLMVYLPDRAELFATICGFFERINYSIVEAKVHTTRHGYALDTFVVLDEENKAHYRDLLSFIEYELTERLKQQHHPLPPPLTGRVSRQVKHFPITPQVNIRPDERGIYHILSVTASDRPGLLSRVAQLFVKHGIQLHSAKITTLGERAEDVFLITAEDGVLNNQKAVLRLETDLFAQLQT